MDITRTFEQTELTTSMLDALKRAAAHLKAWGDCLDVQEELSKYERLYDHIKNEKLDVRLVSREY